MAMEILIADSDKADQEEFQRIFENTDYHPVFSDNGEDALLRAKLFKPDLIIAGVSLSEKDGLELCEAIKTDPEYRNIPFILLTEIFEDISDKDRLRVGADGVISKPLRDGAILSLVDQVMEEKGSEKKEDEFLAGGTDWSSFSDTEKSVLEEKDGFSLEGLDETEDEEIIELVDVVEEPEPKMSINDFVALEKEEPAGEITPLESWEELLEEEKKPAGEPPKEVGKVSPGKVEKKGKETKAKSVALEDELSPEEDLFEKIELEEILEKVERMKPSLEKEWPAKGEPKGAEWQPPPAAEEEAKPVEWQLPAEEEEKPTEWQPPPAEEKAVEWQRPADEGDEKLPGLEEFESALKSGLPDEPSREELAPFSFEEPEEEISVETAPVATEIPVEEEEVKALPKEELEDLEVEEEEFPEALFEEEELEEKDISPIKEIEEESIEIFEGLEAPKAPPVKKAEEERVEIFEEARAPEILPSRGPSSEGIDLFEEWEAPKAPSVMEFETERKEISPFHAGVAERRMEEVIAEGVQIMMEDFIKKVLPEMTQNIVGLTVDRIEKMVREMVPDLAEKAIQEEIKRLQKGEKE